MFFVVDLSRLGRNRLLCVKMVVDGVELVFDLAHLGVGNASAVHYVALGDVLFYFHTIVFNFIEWAVLDRIQGVNCTRIWTG